MSDGRVYRRRRLLRRTFLTFATGNLLSAAIAAAPRPMRNTTQLTSAKNNSFGPARSVQAGVLNVGYVELGPIDGPVVILLHGWPYDIGSFVASSLMLAEHGCRVIVPHLRGHGTTHFLEDATPRSGQQAAIGADVIALMDALNVPSALLAGFDWGGRAACVAAALWPERCSGLVSVNSYLIQDIARASSPLAVKTEAAFWYQFYFLTERGRLGLSMHRRDIARFMWTRNSPNWFFDEATFLKSAEAFDNPDYVEIVIHSYRHRLGHSPGYPEFDELEKRLAMQPPITVPTITLDGDADGVVEATDGRSTAAKFSGFREHRVIRNVGHNLPQEDPAAFASAILDLLGRCGTRTATI